MGDVWTMTAILRRRLAAAAFRATTASLAAALPLALPAALTVALPLGLAGPARAAGLDSGTVGRWLDASQALEAWSNTLPEDRREALDGAGDPAAMMGDMADGRMLSAAVSRMAGAPEAAQAAGIVSKHGFSGLDDWATVGDRVMQAYMAIEMQGEDVQGQRAEMEAARSQIMNSPDMTAEQKKMMLQMLGNAGAMMDQAGKADPADIAAVQPHLERIRSMGGSD